MTTSRLPNRANSIEVTVNDSEITNSDLPYETLLFNVIERQPRWTAPRARLTSGRKQPCLVPLRLRHGRGRHRGRFSEPDAVHRQQLEPEVFNVGPGATSCLTPWTTTSTVRPRSPCAPATVCRLRTNHRDKVAPVNDAPRMNLGDLARSTSSADLRLRHPEPRVRH